MWQALKCVSLSIKDMALDLDRECRPWILRPEVPGEETGCVHFPKADLLDCRIRWSLREGRPAILLLRHMAILHRESAPKGEAPCSFSWEGPSRQKRRLPPKEQWEALLPKEQS